MAGIGFELRKAIRQGTLPQRAGGYLGAAFSCSGSMLVGIVVFILIQVSARRQGVSSEVTDAFMCYVTNIMFFSMLMTSAVTLPLSRYVSDQIYMGRRARVMPSLIGGVVLVNAVTCFFMLPLLLLSEVTLLTGILLGIFALVLNVCWLLMTYITLLRDYRQIVAAFLSAMLISWTLLIILTRSGALALPSMILVLLICFSTVDALLFRTIYRRFPWQEGPVFAFLSQIRFDPRLMFIGYLLMLGMLGHFWLVWFFSGYGNAVDTVFRYGPNYDFPAIVAYFSTIPAAIYFVTVFETRFSRRYQQYFRLLGHSGTIEEIHNAREGMFGALYSGFRTLCSIQMVACLLAVTAGAKLLNVMNIGMTLDMLNTFRMFCVGYSLYYIGNVITLIQLYFVNERKVIRTALFFCLAANLATWACFTWVRNSWGLGFTCVSLLWDAFSLWQLIRYLSRLEYNALGRQELTVLSKTEHKPERSAPWTVRSRWVKTALILSALLVLFSSASMLRGFYQKKLIRHYIPEASDEVLRSPGMGLAPWAENKESLEMNTSLVYVELKWADWEPEEGVYDVDFVNDYYNLEFYREDGRQVVFRFVCDEPKEDMSDGDDLLDIPDWLYEQTADGSFYSTENGEGYSPNYENKLFIEKHRQAISALGANFGQDDFFCYVELGSLGHWGEWHVDFQSGIKRLPEYAVREAYIRPYLTAFPNARFLMRYPLLEVVANGFGMYNDLTGDYDETRYWLEQMNGGVWEQTGLVEQAVCTDVWKTQPIGGEFSPLAPNRTFLIDKFDLTLEGITESHQSFIGPKIIVDESDNLSYNTAMEEILKRLGYRFRVSEVTLDFREKDSFDIICTLTNDGIAPIYQPYHVVLYLYDEDGEPVWESEDNGFDLTAVLPGEQHEIRIEIQQDDLDDDMRYLLCIAITDADRNPCVPMALADMTENGVYALAQFSIQ